MKDPNNPCIFCKIRKEELQFENQLAYSSKDSYPVSELHSLIVPKRHVETYFDLTKEEIQACNELILKTKERPRYAPEQKPDRSYQPHLPQIDLIMLARPLYSTRRAPIPMSAYPSDAPETHAAPADSATFALKIHVRAHQFRSGV